MTWTPEEDAILAAAWADDATSPLPVAIAALPNHTEGAIQVRACLQGYAKARRERRRERRAALGLTRGVIARRTRVAPPAPPPPPRVVPLVARRPGPCDRGDQEYIRRRLIVTMDALAKELGRSPVAVANAVRAIADDQFREIGPLGYELTDLAPTAPRSCKPRPRVSA